MNEEKMDIDGYLRELSFEAIPTKISNILNEYDFEFRDIDLFDTDTKIEIINKIEQAYQDDDVWEEENEM